jgi:hypothetical protein
VLVVMPWLVRNLVTFEETVTLSTNSEEVLFYANCPDTYEGPLIGFWSFNCQERVRAERMAAGLPADPPGDESQRAAAWGELGREFARENADRWPAVGVARVTRAWDLQHSDVTARAMVFEGRDYDWTVRGLWIYRLLLLPAVVGLVLLRRRGTAVWPLLVTVGVISFTALAVYGHPSFRTVGDLLVVVAAAVAFDALLARRRGKAPASEAVAGTTNATAPVTDRTRAHRPMTTPPPPRPPRHPRPRPTAGPRDGVRRCGIRGASSGGAGAGGAGAAPSGLAALPGPADGGGLHARLPGAAPRRRPAPPRLLAPLRPGSLWALAAWYKVVGVSLTAERLFGFAQIAGIVFGMMALVWPWGRRVAATAGIFGVLLTTTAIGLTALAWNGAIALLVVSTWAGLRARRWLTEPPGGSVAARADRDDDDDVRSGAPDAARSADRLLVLSGALAGIALLFRPDVVVASGLAALAMLAGLGLARWRRWLLGAVPVLALYLVHLVVSGPRNVIEGMFLEPVFELRGGRTLPRPPSWDTFDGALQKVALLRPQDWALPSLSSPQQAFVWFFLLPAATAFVVGVGWWRVRQAPGAWRPRVVLTVGLLGLGLLPQALQRPDTTHLAWVACVTFAFLPAAIAELLAHIGPSSSRRHAPTLAALAVALLPLAVIPHFTARTWVDLVQQSISGNVFGYPVTYEGRTFYLGAADIAPVAQRMLEEVGPQMEPGERLLVGTADLRKTPYSDAYFYFLLPELVPGTRYIEMDPGIANAEDSGLADEVRSSDWLILSRVWDGWDEPNDSRLFGSDEPNQVVDELFCPVGDFEPYFEVYRRCR